MSNKADNIKQYLRKHLSDEEIEKLSTSIIEDAETRHSQVVGFGSEPETSTVELKEFGEGHATQQKDKLMKWKVADTDTITYPNKDGVTEAYAFDGYTLNNLGKKLEGVPLVIAETEDHSGHDAELPFAVFTSEYEVVEEKSEAGVSIKSLYQWAKLRNDSDSPIDFEALVQNPELSVNGGTRNLHGSLKFKSRDVPYFYEDGSKINYMTSPVPTHYAGVDIPVIKGAGLVEKTFGKTQKETGDIMTDKTEQTANAEVATQSASVDVEAVLKDRLSELDMADLMKGAAIDEIVKNVVAGLGTPDTVARAEYDDLVKQRDALLEEKTAAELDGLRKDIVSKALGASADNEAIEAFVEQEGLKEFGKAELNGYLKALTAAASRKTESTEEKSFGKGKVDMTNAEKKRKFPQIKL